VKRRYRALRAIGRQKHQRGGLYFMGAFVDLVLDPEVNESGAEFDRLAKFREALGIAGSVKGSAASRSPAMSASTTRC